MPYTDLGKRMSAPPRRRPQHFRRRKPGTLGRRVAVAAVPVSLAAAVGATGAAGLSTPPTATATATAHLPVSSGAGGAAHPTVALGYGDHWASLTAWRAPASTPVVRPAAGHRGQHGADLAGFGGADPLPGPHPSGDLVGLATVPGGGGYWVVNADGQVFAHGTAPRLGSVAAHRLTGRVAGIAAAPGGGYWVVAADGRVFAFGRAPWHGSLAHRRLHSPVVGIAATPDGNGYWLATAGGGVFPFGDAKFAGSPNAAGVHHHAAIVGIAAPPTGSGYWLAASDGTVFHYGAAAPKGSLPRRHLSADIVSIAATPTGAGYWLASRHGAVFAFGDATYRGSTSPEPPTARVTAIAADAPGGYLELATAVPPPARTNAVRVSLAATGTPLGNFVVTCYDLQGTTASGAPVSLATVAVDPSVIPLGAVIDIGGVGTRVAQDTGGAIIGNRLDIWEPTYQQCMNWGVRTENVRLLKR